MRLPVIYVVERYPRIGSARNRVRRIYTDQRTPTQPCLQYPVNNFRAEDGGFFLSASGLIHDLENNVAASLQGAHKLLDVFLLDQAQEIIRSDKKLVPVSLGSNPVRIAAFESAVG